MMNDRVVRVVSPERPKNAMNESWKSCTSNKERPENKMNGKDKRDESKQTHIACPTLVSLNDITTTHTLLAFPQSKDIRSICTYRRIGRGEKEKRRPWGGGWPGRACSVGFNELDEPCPCDLRRIDWSCHRCWWRCGFAQHGPAVPGLRPPPSGPGSVSATCWSSDPSWPGVARGYHSRPLDLR